MSAKGAAFLLNTVKDGGEVFTPENLTEEQKAFQLAVKDFVDNEVLPNSEKIENQEDGVSPALLKKAGELGFLMVEVPENYGGLGMDKATATVVSEASSKQGSFGVTLMCQTGIATLPILYYGTEEQKQKYLPKLASGEFIGAYALTEAGSGSDALGAKTKAVLSEDGKSYTLNGSKMWITNGSWADLFTVFAQVDGDKFTAFLIEKGTKGLSTGAEEKKMGIKGSSTVEVTLDDCQIPVENVLGEIGKGHKIAFNVLNIGRWKLGAAALGGCKKVIADMIPYITERKQFNTSISEFGMVRKMLADAALLTFVNESLVYRIAGLYDSAINAIDKSLENYDQKCIEAIEEYAVEASIAKVFGSEALWEVCDLGVQALGGYGFSQEYPMEKAQRDARINRIFEGTNEINRLIIPGTILKRAMKGELDLMAEIPKILSELKDGFENFLSEDLKTRLENQVNLSKKLTVYACGVAVQKHMQNIKDEQYILEKMANLAIETFAMDATLKRVFQMSENQNQIGLKLAEIFISESYQKMLSIAKSLMADIADGNQEELGKSLKALKRFDIFMPVATSPLRDEVAAFMIQKGEYALY